MNTERLLKLADFLETVPPGNFVIDGWVEKEADKPEGEKPGQCGFSGCAVGWAVHANLFEGLSFHEQMPLYKGQCNWEAVVELFEFEDDGCSEFGSAHAQHLFYEDSYRDGTATPAVVAARIRKLVEDHSSSPSGARSA